MSDNSNNDSLNKLINKPFLSDLISSKFLRVIILILIFVVGSGSFGLWISSIYSDRIAKRDITARVVKIVSDKLLVSRSIPANIRKASDNELAILLAQKEHAFLVRKLIKFLENNYEDINFEHFLPALNSVETRYSFASIYEAADMVDILCENLYFNNDRREIIIKKDLGKCKSEAVLFLDELKLELVDDIDVNNQTFRVKISNDHGGYLCYPKSRIKSGCSFPVDVTDRLENLPYESMIIAEYIGYSDPFSQKEPIVYFSIVKRKTEEDDDTSYWDYGLNLSDDKDIHNTCEDFFDNDGATDSKPSPPKLDNFDRAVLRACGRLGGKVTGREFRQLIYDHYDHIMRVMKPHPLGWLRKTKYEIINELHRIWTLHGGFTHIFCGDWDGGSIGGFHDRGRYLQLQMEGKACYFKSPLEDVLPNYVYTIGVESADRLYRHKIKGYSLNKSSMDLFIFTTKAYYKFFNNSGGWSKDNDGIFRKSVYIETVEKGRNIIYRVLCYANDYANPLTYGIKTVYPDLTPDDGYKVVKDDSGVKP